MNTVFSFRYTGLLILSLAGFTFSTALPADNSQPVPRIVVTGEGRVDLAPDMAILSLTVTRQEETARAALDANSMAMSAVQKAMTSAGVAARDLQTSGFSIQPKYFYPPQQKSGEREPPRIVGYTVRNSLTVRVRDISNVGAILDKSVSLGVNEGGNISFTNEDPSEAITEARIRAMKHAISKAGTLAKAAGVKTGQILEISEQSYTPRPVQMARAEVSMGMAADSVPVAAGENSYKVTVNVSFAIDQ